MSPALATWHAPEMLSVSHRPSLRKRTKLARNRIWVDLWAPYGFAITNGATYDYIKSISRERSVQPPSATPPCTPSFLSHQVQKGRTRRTCLKVATQQVTKVKFNTKLRRTARCVFGSKGSMDSSRGGHRGGSKGVRSVALSFWFWLNAHNREFSSK